ncbi:MAG: DUF5110 domain-containing protein [Bacteroidales bacterium]|nr:DUF5110 domain-containing protein [Bacteroidales bacterium]
MAITGGGKDALFDQLNLGLSGFSNTSIDVLDVKQNHIAAMHLGFMLPWVQINSWYTLLHPWYFPPNEKEAFTYYARLRHSLNPYIYSAAIENHLTGKPILRAMPLEFPDDREVDNMIYQYMFGDNILVGVFSDSVYLPQGKWINFWDNEIRNGGKKIHAGYPQNRGGAMFVKAGAIIAYREISDYLGEEPLHKVQLSVYPQGRSEYTLYEDDGVSFDYEKGKIASTRFTSHAENKSLEFVIEATQGDYNGRPLSRGYSINFFTIKKPATVKVNGKITDKWSYDGSGKLSLEVDRQENERTQILITN